jgi:hypothetical protein
MRIFPIFYVPSFALSALVGSLVFQLPWWGALLSGAVMGFILAVFLMTMLGFFFMFCEMILEIVRS